MAIRLSLAEAVRRAFRRAVRFILEVAAVTAILALLLFAGQASGILAAVNRWLFG